MSVKNDNYGQFRCWLLHFSFAKNKFYFSYPLAHAQKVNQFFTFSETKPKNQSVSRFSLVLFQRDWIECFTESKDFSTKRRFNRVSVFLLRLFSVREIPVILSLDYWLHQKQFLFPASMITIILSTQDCTWHFTSVFGLKLRCFFGWIVRKFLLFFQYFVFQRWYHGADLFFFCVRR